MYGSIANFIDELTDLIEGWRKNPVKFVRDVFEVEPDPWQRRALMGLVTKKKVSVRSGHGVGKSTLDAWSILWFMCCFFPCKVPCTAPSKHQLYDILWAELAKWFRRMPPQLREQFEMKGDRLELKAAPLESFAVARTARKENPEALQGFHSEHLMFVIDEASGVEEAIFEVAEGALSTPGALVLMTANPTRPSGYFYDTHHKLRSLWMCIKVSCLDSTRVSEDYILSMKKRYGEDSNVYKVRVLGEFPRVGDDSVIPVDICESAIHRDVASLDHYQVVWGLDVARYGYCLNALCKRRANEVLEPIKTWGGVDLMETVGKVVREYRDTPQEMRPVEILVDVIGLGAGVLDRLVELGMPARGVNVGESASSNEKYGRLRDELWFRAREWLDAKNCKLPEDDYLVGELTTITYKVQSNGKLKVESKEEMHKRGVDSPDRGDCFVLTFAGGVDLVDPSQEMPERYQTKKVRRGGWMSR